MTLLNVYPSYESSNATDDWMHSWYIREDQQLAGLLTDFHFRHEPGKYETPNSRTIRVLRLLFFCTPAVTMLLCWALFTESTDWVDMAASTLCLSLPS